MVTGVGRGRGWNWISAAIISISVISVQTVFQAVVWFCYKCSRQTGVRFWRKQGFRQRFGFLSSIPNFCKNTKADGIEGGGGWYPKFWRSGVGEVLPNSDPFGQTKKEGQRCKNWTFFLDVINVWSHMGRIQGKLGLGCGQVRFVSYCM